MSGYDKKYPRFGAWLSQQRKRLGMTQVQAADACKVSADAYQAWEQGVRWPVPRMRARLCRGLRIDPMDPHWMEHR